MNSKKQKLLVVCGPTASGKTGVALELARRYGGEVISADSMQLYNGLVVGTAALTQEEAAGVPYHLTGFLPPEQAFSVAEYVELARDTIAEVARRGALPIVCGGTGLYIKSLVEGVDFTPQPVDEALRTKLENDYEKMGGEAMLARLREEDPVCAERLHAKDKKRILRALEQYALTGKTALQREEESRPAQEPYDALCLGLGCADRQTLYARIEQRVDEMIDKGLPEEAQMVYNNREAYKTAVQAIGYKELFPYFEGASTLQECAAALKQATRRYAKRQLTWFRGMPQVRWIMIDEPDAAAQLEKLADNWLSNKSGE